MIKPEIFWLIKSLMILHSVSGELSENAMLMENPECGNTEDNPTRIFE